MREVTFALLREGTSDDGLVAHIRSLILSAGADAALGAARQYSGSVASKLSRVLAEDPAVDLIFVHRDSDTRDPTPRHTEVTRAAEFAACADRVIPVIPVQELEAWLLVDEAQIRAVVGKPNGRLALGLPQGRHIENVANPKELLRSACMIASETSGSRRRRQAASFDKQRAILLERMDSLGPVSTLPSWQRFVADTTRGTVGALARM